MAREIEMPMPDDMHVHFRQGEMLKSVVPHTVRQFGRALVMPNLRPKPILTAVDAYAYGQEIMGALIEGGSFFLPLMTIQITEETTPEQVIDARHLGVVAGKIYPRGVTTHSDNGVSDYRKLWPVFEAMQGCDLVLSLHGESSDPKVSGLSKEVEFLHIVRDIALNFPRLRIVLEHITTRAAVDFIKTWKEGIAATITLHHLLLTLDDVIGYSQASGGLLQPHHYCKPVAKFEADRRTLINAAVFGGSKFFFGSDSAPHLRRAKECAGGCAGIYTAPVAMPMLADVFETRGALERLPTFVTAGQSFYRLPPNKQKLVLRREPWPVPESYPVGDDSVVPFMAGQTLNWQVVA